MRDYSDPATSRPATTASRYASVSFDEGSAPLEWPTNAARSIIPGLHDCPGRVISMPRDPNPSLPWPEANPLPDSFFDRDALQVARELLGKVIRHRVGDLWLSVRIIETEAYYLAEKGSHASLGYTEKRKA